MCSFSQPPSLLILPSSGVEPLLANRAVLLSFHCLQLHVYVKENQMRYRNRWNVLLFHIQCFLLRML